LTLNLKGGFTVGKIKQWLTAVTEGIWFALFLLSVLLAKDDQEGASPWD
jgi:hypothetical protein